jgi:radical SAM superfamily enzyme YgiQ (UPF0313 family)
LDRPQKQDYHGWNSPEPIGLEYVASSLSSAGFKVCFVSQYEFVVSYPGVSQELSFVSGVTSEWPKIKKVAFDAKQAGRIVILGGYHVCGYWENINDNNIDYIVRGEGEDIAVVLAKIFLRNETVNFDRHNYNSGNLPVVIKAPVIDNINRLPFPMRSQKRIGKDILFDLMYPTRSLQNNTLIVLTSRGCKYNCDFCSSATVWESGVRKRSCTNIISELREIKERFGTNTIIIIDQSFGQEKGWTIEVCNEIKKAGIDINWYHQSNLGIDEETIEAMAGAGCTKIGFGLEGLSEKTVKKVKAINPHSIDIVNNLFGLCRSKGMLVKAYTMLGYPWETEDDVLEYKKFLKELRANQIKISYATPFPGTKYWDMYKDRLLTDDWAMFDTISMPVIRNDKISVERYAQIRTELFRTFYGSESYSNTVKDMILTGKELGRDYTLSFREFEQYLRQNGMLTGKEAWLDLVKAQAIEIKDRCAAISD